MSKKKVLFIGSFKNRSSSGGVGGQMYACNSLISSSLKNDYEWLLIDSTAYSNLDVGLIYKIPQAIIRFVKFFYYLAVHKVSNVLIFSAHGLSFLEKGIMVIIAQKLSSANVILAPRSGKLKDELQYNRRVFGGIVFKNADRVICQGESWKVFFEKNFELSSEKYVVQKNWIENELYPKASGGTDKLNILYLAWIQKTKGIFDLIQAVQYMIESNERNFAVHIAGRGKHEKKAYEFIQEKKLEEYFIFHGWVLGSEKIKLIKNSDIFVLPSYFEGMPNALIECMAAGLACIATDVGAIPDIIIDEENGLLVPKGDVLNLKEALLKLLMDDKLRNRIKKNAREYVEREHSLLKAIENFRLNIFIQ